MQNDDLEKEFQKMLAYFQLERLRFKTDVIFEIGK